MPAVVVTIIALGSGGWLLEQGVDAHAWGRVTHALPAPPSEPEDESAHARSLADAAASQSGAAPNEFVFELLGPDADSDYGMNVTSCAICHLFSRYDAMELVPYMCSYDDVTSRAGDTGLRRTGTIALGGDRIRISQSWGDRETRLSI